jgi:hypothetical protein
VVAGDSKVTVTVAAGTATDGTLGGVPASYTVTASPAVSGGTCTVTAASGSCDVTGLTNGTAYTFTATAKNGASDVSSAASSPSATVTPIGAPGQPGIGAVSATGPTTATVTFTAPSSDGGSPITTYTATSSPAGGTGTLSQAGSGTLTVTGLTLGTSYTFTVTATNAKGTSPVSAASVPVTLVAVSGARYKVDYFDAYQGGSSPTVPARQWVARGSSVTIAANVATPCADSCWGFAGWSPLTDDSGAIYSPGDVITPTANMNLYAQWFPMITYDPNGGLGTMPTKAMPVGGRMEAPTFTNGSLLFVGWNTKADGTGKLYNTGTTPGSRFADTTVTKMKVYAQWGTQLKVSFDANDGSSGVVKEAFVNYPTQKIYITANSDSYPKITREGYNLTGWCADPFPVVLDWCRSVPWRNDGETSFNLKQDLRLFARWEKN